MQGGLIVAAYLNRGAEPRNLTSGKLSAAATIVRSGFGTFQARRRAGAS